MKIFPVSKIAPAPAGANDRRSFLQKLGVGVSTALGSATVMAKPDNSKKANDLSLQVARLETEKALRALHQQYEQAMDKGEMDAVLPLFAQDAEVVFNGGVFSGREQGIARLYGQYFMTSKTGKRMEAAPGFVLSAEQLREQVDVAVDLRTARAAFPYSIQAGRPLESASSLASMARAQGEGVQTWWEGGVYELDYAQDLADGSWKIKRLAYNTLSRADYRAGRSYAKAIVVPAFSAHFPEHAQGPDRLV
jgi:uncharacterized protein (TIGR02246 family)